MFAGGRRDEHVEGLFGSDVERSGMSPSEEYRRIWGKKKRRSKELPD